MSAILMRVLANVMQVLLNAPVNVTLSGALEVGGSLGANLIGGWQLGSTGGGGKFRGVTVRNVGGEVNYWMGVLDIRSVSPPHLSFRLMANIHKRIFSSIDESQSASAAADRAEGDAGVARGGSSTVKCVERVVGASTPSVGRLSSFVAASAACLCVTQVRL